MKAKALPVKELAFISDYGELGLSVEVSNLSNV